MPITSKRRLKELPSIYTEIPADQTGKIEPTKNFFDKIIKQVPATPKKKINIQYDKKNNSYNIEEEWIQMKKISNFKIYFDLFKTTLKVFLYNTKVNKSKDSCLC